IALGDGRRPPAKRGGRLDHHGRGRGGQPQHLRAKLVQRTLEPGGQGTLPGERRQPRPQGGGGGGGVGVERRRGGARDGRRLAGRQRRLVPQERTEGVELARVRQRAAV